MKILKKISVLLLFIIVFAACKDNNVPKIDKTKVEQDRLLGSWEIASTKAYVNVNSKYKLQLAPFDLEDKLQKRLDELTANSGFHFEKEKIYFIKYGGMIRDSSRYELDEYKILLDNSYLIGSYAPYFYIKFSDDLLVTYLRRSETMELLKREDDMKSWMSLIESAVDDAQCELRFRRREKSYFDYE